MLTKPAIDDTTIAACLRDAYGLDTAALAFLPLGADRNTAVYRAETDAGVLFVKLRGGPFDDLPVRVPWLLRQHGIEPVIAPLATRAGALWTRLDGFTLTVFPFVTGRDGSETPLSEAHWHALGRALRAIHALELPADLAARIQRETYSGAWREKVRGFLALAAERSFADPVSADLAALLLRERPAIEALVRRADALAASLAARALPAVLCHADIHAWNVLIDPDDALYIVDWDTVTLAPKERDLMFPGGGLFGGWRSPHEEEALFYAGYGPAAVDRDALAYYRCERAVQDIAEFCAQILYAEPGDPDRANSLRLLSGQFRPGQVVELALRTGL